VTDSLTQVAQLTAQRETAAGTYGDLDQQWRAAIIEATHTHSDIEVAAAARVTRGRVYQIKNGRRT
jgi:hypothetical protein